MSFAAFALHRAQFPKIPLCTMRALSVVLPKTLSRRRLCGGSLRSQSEQRKLSPSIMVALVTS